MPAPKTPADVEEQRKRIATPAAPIDDVAQQPARKIAKKSTTRRVNATRDAGEDLPIPPDMPACIHPVWGRRGRLSWTRWCEGTKVEVLLSHKGFKVPHVAHQEMHVQRMLQ